MPDKELVQLFKAKPARLQVLLFHLHRAPTPAELFSATIPNVFEPANGGAGGESKRSPSAETPEKRVASL